MTPDDHPTHNPLHVTTLEGCVVDLEPLVASAQGLRRNALQNAEFGDGTGIDHRTLSGMLMGMQVAVGTLCGEYAADLFHAHVNFPCD